MLCFAYFVALTSHCVALALISHLKIIIFHSCCDFSLKKSHLRIERAFYNITGACHVGLNHTFPNPQKYLERSLST